MTFRKKTIIAAVILIFIILSIGATLYLVSKPQTFRSKAAASVSAAYSLLAQPEKAGIGEKIRILIFANSDRHFSNLFVVNLNFPKDKLQLEAINPLSFNPESFTRARGAVKTAANYSSSLDANCDEKVDDADYTLLGNDKGGFAKYWIKNSFDNQTGKINLVAGVATPGFKTSGPEGKALLACITFKVLSAQQSTISFDDSSAMFGDADNLDILETKEALVVNVPTQAPPPPGGAIPEPNKLTQGIDLEVTYIERNPKYSRYRMTYFANRDLCAPENPNYYPYADDRGPKLCPGEEGKKRWPDSGEKVTFTAYFRNRSAQPQTVKGVWKIDGSAVKTEDLVVSGFSNGQSEYQWSWPGGNTEEHKVAFQIDADQKIAEKYEQNNAIEDYTNAKSFGYFFSPQSFAYLSKPFDKTGQPSYRQWDSPDPVSPEYYMQKHVRYLNEEVFKKAGTNERLRIDRFFLASSNAPEGVDPAGWRGEIARSQSDWWLQDGWWGEGGDDRPWYDANTNERSLDIGFARLHEWVHQFGTNHPDTSTDVNYGQSNPVFRHRTLDGKVAGCEDADNDLIPGDTRICYLPPHWLADMLQGYGELGYFHAYGLNSSLGFRRGYFGDYMFDTPANVALKIKDQDGNPVANATVRWRQNQNRSFNTTFDGTGTTSNEGVIVLPNKQGKWVGTALATGHQLKPNPFGNIEVNGRNGTMLFEVEKDNKLGYLWLSIDLVVTGYAKTRGVLPARLDTAEKPIPNIVKDATFENNTLYLPRTAHMRPIVYTPSPFPAVFPPGKDLSQVSGDVNEDNRVDLLDLSILLTKFGNTTNLGEADLDENGVIDNFDIKLLTNILRGKGL